jgi:proteasome accessory factor B
MAQADKVERLFNLVAALLETRRPLTREELHRRVPGYPQEREPFRRAFERDKDDLRELGIPLEVEDVPGRDPPIVGYRIPKDEYYLRDPGLEPDELAALHLAAEAVRLEGIEGGGALWKLGGVPDDDSGRDLQRGQPSEVSAIPSDDNLVVLFGAVGERRPASFTYRGTLRTVDPYRLDFARGRWYVSGFDHVRGEERNFRLDRIEGDVTTGEPGAFERPSTTVPGARLAPWQLGDADAERLMARVLVDPDQAAMARTMVDPAAVVDERVDGSVVIELEVRHRDGFRSFVLDFLEHAEVLEPEVLRDDLVAWLTDIAQSAPSQP